MFVGTAVGVLPGLGPVATISLLLPFSFTMDITSALILMAGVFYGAQYGGSITAILVRIPGEASAVVTCLDGYAMARQGRAGAALGIAAFGSFIAGVLVTIALFVVGPALANVALAFGPAEYTALVLLGLLLVTQLSSGSQISALLMVAFGLLLSTVGKDPIYGTERFTFGMFTLFDGLNIALLAMGMFGVAELLVMAAGGDDEAAGRRPAGPALRAAAVARGLARELPADPARHRAGLLPRAAAGRRRDALVVHRLCAGAPAREKSRALRPGRDRGRGGAGIRQQCRRAVLVRAAALARHSGQCGDGRSSSARCWCRASRPGRTLIANRPDIFFGVIASMLIGNLMLIVLNVPLISIFVQLLRVPGAILAPLIIVFCVVGAYTLSNSVVEVIIMIGFGIAGYLMRKVDLDPAPLVLAFVLGNILETNFRQALLVGRGTLSLFYTRPIAATLLACCVGLIAWQVWKMTTARR